MRVFNHKHILCFYIFLHAGFTALMIAAKEGNAVLVQILIGASAILDFKEKEVYSLNK